MSEPSVADILRQARALIEPEGAWTQGEFARGDGGYCVLWDGDSARQWCALGAIKRAAGQHGPMRDAWEAINAVCVTEFDDELIDWNDRPERTQADVLALYDRAIALAEQEASQ